MSKPLQFSTQKFTAYSPATLKHNGDCWLIEFYAFSPASGALERRRIKLNRLRRAYTSAAAFRKHALQMVCEINVKLAGGWSPFGETQNARLFMPLVDAMDAYLAEKERELRPATLMSYKSICKSLRNYCEQNLPDIRTSAFNRVHAVAYLDYCFMVRQLSARAWNNQLKGARALFSWLQQKCYVKENPFFGIKTKREEQKRRIPIPPDSRQRIAAWCEANNPHFLTICELVFNALLRPMEVTRLKIADVDLPRKTLHLSPAATKTHYERDAALSDALVERLAAMHLESYPDNYYVFGQSYKPCREQMQRSRLSKDWVVMRIACQLPAEMQLYSLRDSGITSLLDSGVPARTVMLAADHHDLKITTRYASSRNPELIEQLNKNAVTF